MDELREHRVHLVSGPLHLRPMTEDDWDILLAWNNDPDVLYYAEGGEITSWPLEAMQRMYRGASHKGFTFVIELDGRPIGECWLRRMNLKRVLAEYPGQDIRRIDIMIGEKELWGHGWGTRAIRLLTRFAFERLHVDLIYNPEIADTNPRSRRAFEKNGYGIVKEVRQTPGIKFEVGYDMALTREEYDAQRRTAPHRILS